MKSIKDMGFLLKVNMQTITSGYSRIFGKIQMPDSLVLMGWGFQGLGKNLHYYNHFQVGMYPHLVETTHYGLNPTE